MPSTYKMPFTVSGLGPQRGQPPALGAGIPGSSILVFGIRQIVDVGRPGHQFT